MGILFPYPTLAQTVRNTETLASLISNQEAVTWESHDLRLEFICLSTKFPVSVRLSKRCLLSFPSPLVLWQSVLSLSSQVWPKKSNCEREGKEKTDTSALPAKGIDPTQQRCQEHWNLLQRVSGFRDLRKISPCLQASHELGMRTMGTKAPGVRTDSNEIV